MLMKFLAALALIFTTTMGLCAGNVGMIEVRSSISPVTESYISRAITVAQRQNDACLIIELDTEGGSVAATQKIVESFYASPVPIVVYVSPSGASATSAGTFITMAADVAAMAPNTTIGAAHPVGPRGEGDTNSIMWTKAENFVATWARSVAEKRGRNAQWIEDAVRHSIDTNAEAAVQLNLVDFIAKDVPDLLRQLDGREVNGSKLKTADAVVTPIPQLMRESMLEFILRPEVMFILMLVALYGIIGELSNPGAILPGVAGGIAAILVLCEMMVLPINIAGVVLLLLAIVLFIIDAHAPTHGILTGGGILAFFLGALMLFGPLEPGVSSADVVDCHGHVFDGVFFRFNSGRGFAGTKAAGTGRERNDAGQAGAGVGAH